MTLSLRTCRPNLSGLGNLAHYAHCPAYFDPAHCEGKDTVLNLREVHVMLKSVLIFMETPDLFRVLLWLSL